MTKIFAQFEIYYQQHVKNNYFVPTFKFFSYIIFPDQPEIPGLWPDFCYYLKFSDFPWLEKLLSFLQVFQVFQC